MTKLSRRPKYSPQNTMENGSIHFYLLYFCDLVMGLTIKPNNDSIETEYLIEGQFFLSNELC